MLQVPVWYNDFARDWIPREVGDPLSGQWWHTLLRLLRLLIHWPVESVSEGVDSEEYEIRTVAFAACVALRRVAAAAGMLRISETVETARIGSVEAVESRYGPASAAAAAGTLADTACTSVVAVVDTLADFACTSAAAAAGTSA